MLSSKTAMVLHLIGAQGLEQRPVTYTTKMAGPSKGGRSTGGQRTFTEVVLLPMSRNTESTKAPGEIEHWTVWKACTKDST